MAENIILCSFLGICSCYDLKLKKIPGWLLYTGILLGALYWGILKVSGQAGWLALPAGLLPGSMMLLYSYITEGKLGTADGLLVLPAGLIQQWQRCTAEIMAACLLIFLLAAGLLISRKGNRDTRIPFAPFFLAAVVLVWIIEAVFGVSVDK
nr:hypothetical protein [uncultured Eisenbergiella sp.]